MGSYEEKAIRWRYVGYVAENGDYTKHENPETAATNKAIFVQQSVGYACDVAFRSGLNESVSLDDVYSNDYAASDVRKLLSGETIKANVFIEGMGTSKVTFNGGIVTLYNLEQDSIYNSILPRTLDDLYSKMSTAGEAVSYPTNANMISKNSEQKLWLLSYMELNNLLGSERENLLWSDTKLDEYSPGQTYWLRTPDGGGYIELGVGNGYVNYNMTPSSLAGFRAAFLLEI